MHAAVSLPRHGRKLHHKQTEPLAENPSPKRTSQTELPTVLCGQGTLARATAIPSIPGKLHQHQAHSCSSKPGPCC